MYSIHVKKISSDKIKASSQIYFKFAILIELKHKVRLSKTVRGIFHFRFVFIEVYIFVQQNTWTLRLKNIVIPFKTKIIEKPHKVLLPDL